ncbi:hypothetical protein RYX36_021354 [Vicia faba]
METQHPESQYSHTRRLLEQTHYHDTYHQSVDPRYSDVQNQSHPSSGYQQFSFVDPNMQRNSGHSHEVASVNLEEANTSDRHSYSARDRTNIGDQTVLFEQENFPTNPSVHPHEGAPVEPGVGYPPIPPSLSLGPQHDASFTTSGHAVAPHGRFPGLGHPSTVPPNGTPYSLNTIAIVHPTATFFVDAYGISGVLECPKKASVPTWLREEIKKTIMGGFIGLVAAIVGLPFEAAQHLEQIVPRVLNSFSDQDSRVLH